MRMVDRDGRPIEVSDERAGDVRQFPVPEDVPDEVLMTKSSSRSGDGDRFYHRPDPENPDRPDCQVAGREEARWRTRSTHGITGNYPACPYCWPEFANEEVVTA